MNDSSVSSSSLQVVLSQQAYLLFYVRFKMKMPAPLQAGGGAPALTPAPTCNSSLRNQGGGLENGRHSNGHHHGSGSSDGGNESSSGRLVYGPEPQPGSGSGPRWAGSSGRQKVYGPEPRPQPGSMLLPRSALQPQPGSTLEGRGNEGLFRPQQNGCATSKGGGVQADSTGGTGTGSIGRAASAPSPCPPAASTSTPLPPHPRTTSLPNGARISISFSLAPKHVASSLPTSSTTKGGKPPLHPPPPEGGNPHPPPPQQQASAVAAPGSGSGAQQAVEPLLPSGSRPSSSGSETPQQASRPASAPAPPAGAALPGSTAHRSGSGSGSELPGASTSSTQGMAGAGRGVSGVLLLQLQPTSQPAQALAAEAPKPLQPQSRTGVGERGAAAGCVGAAGGGVGLVGCKRKRSQACFADELLRRRPGRGEQLECVKWMLDSSYRCVCVGGGLVCSYWCVCVCVRAPGQSLL